MGNFFESIGTFFNGNRDGLPWCDSDCVFQWECIFASSSDEKICENRRGLLRALVLSEHPEDVQLGITMLQGSLLNPSNPSQKKKEMYLLAVGYYRSGEYSKSRDLVDACLDIEPKWYKPIVLKKLVEDGLKKDEVKGTLTAFAMTVGVVTRILALTIQSSYPTWGFEGITFKNLIEDRAKKASLPNASIPLLKKEEVYLLAHRYYIRGNYSRSRHLVDCCLKIATEWMPAITLKKSIEDSIKKYEVVRVCVGVTATVSLVAGAVISMKK